MEEESLKEQWLQVAMEVEIVSINSLTHNTYSSIEIIQCTCLNREIIV